MVLFVFHTLNIVIRMDPNKFMSKNHSDLKQAFKQFSLETERLEAAYQRLQEQFKLTQSTLQNTHTQLSGKLAELHFVTHYLDTILNHISQGILFVDLNGLITTCNAMAASWLNVNPQAVLFHPFWYSFEEDAFGFSIKEALQTKQCPKNTFIEWTIMGGKQLHLEIETTFIAAMPSISPAFNLQASPPIQGILILIRNVTQMHRLQEAVNRADRFKELGEMAARLAHEIRNPLGGIKGFATLLKEELKDHPDLQAMAIQIIEGTEGLSRFVTNVLNHVRPFQIQLESVDLVPFLQELCQLIQADKAFHSNMICQFQTQLKHLFVIVDPYLLRSAILNLLVNALQAMPNGGTLTVEVDQENEHALIDIKDTGIGIQEDDLPKLFSPFFTTKEQGNGLGLSEVYKVIQAHQGIIEVSSEVGKGTIFTIQLPLKTG
jgi:signal transduction histidine kinase